MGMLKRITDKWNDKRKVAADKRKVGDRLYPIDERWDMVLNYLLDNHEIVKADEHYVTFDNNTQVWIANRFHAFGYPFYPHKRNVLPSPATAIRLDNMIRTKREECLRQNIEEFKTPKRKETK